MFKKQSLTTAFCLLLLMATGVVVSNAQDDVERPTNWDDYSHSNDTDPVYDVVFPQDAVNSITITISPENWQAMQDNMTDLFGAFGTRQDRGDFGPNNGGDRPQGFQPPDGAQPPEGAQPPGDDNQQPGQPPQGFQQPDGGGRGFPGGAGGMNFADEDPMWVEATITFNGETWTNVGIRYKGNSTLSGAWGGGSLKLGFKLNFDKYEDDYPEIDNQRFYGFDELSFSSNFRDESYLHEKVAADLFREAGIVSAQTAFYAVYMDYGDGPVYIGLYTVVEEIDDTVLDAQFDDDDGNLYKPEGTGAAFQAGTFDEASFEKKTNEDEADFSDILALFNALHDDTRISDPATWRANLEAVFDVDTFIHWLAVNTVIQNWDTYGAMAHNYYLYNDPTTGLLTWIPWDNNEALTSSGGSGRRSNGNGIDLSTVADNWPLISYLMGDPVYKELYDSYVEDTVANVFVPEEMAERYTTLHELIAPYVTGEATGAADPQLTSETSFEQSLQTLINHVRSRYDLAMTYLGQD